ncbi:hypothetical protein CSHOW_1102 [Campylobacter showae]|uniref:Uncharacterized protein n=1 Tax=Campylobacter showae RM3277 TaxID=553219 RepID=C6RGI1_9BACT|nr:hypothetical protein [Campylobacter showae]EET79531.1 hypothetical protein CAMSH0001_0635 [Campylobacter showae RM3277]QCD49031.1 hypothetical protein CSHOW_1102 [Campylobacter showae]
MSRFVNLSSNLTCILNLNSNFNAQILLPSSPNPYRFGANHGFKTDRNIHGKKSKFNQIYAKQGSLTKIRVKFIILEPKFKLLKLILMYNISLSKIIKISNLRSKNGRDRSKG